MRVFDSVSGKALVEGSIFTNDIGTRTVMQINAKPLRPTITLLQHETGHCVILPLVVRWMHPDHRFERVAFIRETPT